MRIRSSRHRGSIAATFIAIALAAGLNGGHAVAQSTPEATGPVTIVSPAEGAEVTGRDVAIGWEAPGLTIVAAADATTESEVHAHFIVDGATEIVAGQPIAKTCGVLHTAANPATLSNLAPGEHTVQLVIANPGHVPVEGLDRPAVTFTVVEDPDAIRITSPENCAEVAGPDVEIAWEAPGLTIVPAKEAKTETDRHAHFIVDGAYVVVEDAPIPADTAGVIHTAANPVTIEGLAPGAHTIQLVIANPGHVPVAGLARPTVSVVVPESSAPAATPAAAGQTTDSLTITAIDIAFTPTELTIPADTDVTVSLPNTGVTMHNFSIDALGISVDIEPGATEEVVINAPAGAYEIYCNVPGHKAAGMTGTLTIE